MTLFVILSTLRLLNFQNILFAYFVIGATREAEIRVLGLSAGGQQTTSGQSCE